jgi:hypothetical protein
MKIYTLGLYLINLSHLSLLRNENEVNCNLLLTHKPVNKFALRNDRLIILTKFKDKFLSLNLDYELS